MTEHKHFQEDELADIERLADMGHGVDDLVARHLVDEIRALREALEPFAEEASRWEKTLYARSLNDPPFGCQGSLIVGDLRRAARALGMKE